MITTEHDGERLDTAKDKQKELNSRINTWRAEQLTLHESKKVPLMGSLADINGTVAAVLQALNDQIRILPTDSDVVDL